MTVYSIYGYGKCKTESAIGITIRGVQHGDKVLYSQFLKDGTSTEILYFDKLDNVTVLFSKTKGIVLPHNITKNNIDEVGKLYKEIFLTLARDKYNLLILDEVLVAIDLGLLSIAMLKLLLIECKDKKIDVYMTGRIRSKDTRITIDDLSDCVTNARCVKHPFDTYCSKCHNTFPYHYTYCPDCGELLQGSMPAKVGRDL